MVLFSILLQFYNEFDIRNVVNMDENYIQIFKLLTTQFMKLGRPNVNTPPAYKYLYIFPTINVVCKCNEKKQRKMN